MWNYLYFNHKWLYYASLTWRIALCFNAKKREDIYNEQFLFVPKLGDWIKITWLPSPYNKPGITNAYTGSQGVVEKLYDDGYMDLRLNGDGGLLLVGTKYKFIKIEAQLCKS